MGEEKRILSKKDSEQTDINAFIAIQHNRREMSYIKLPDRLKDMLGVFLYWHGLTNKQLEVYNKLDGRKKAGFLFKHILKTASNLKVPSPLIKTLLEKKMFYDEYKFDNGSYDDKLVESIKNSEYGELKNLYSKYHNYEKVKKELLEYTELVIQTIHWLSQHNSQRKEKIEKIFEID